MCRCESESSLENLREFCLDLVAFERRADPGAITTIQFISSGWGPILEMTPPRSNS